MERAWGEGGGFTFLVCHISLQTTNRTTATNNTDSHLVILAFFFAPFLLPVLLFESLKIMLAILHPFYHSV